ncbi:carboxypeptidase-like regulatory domain-containing protein [Lutibacter citreus]|uniref:carboxypeptidase-like regulatory domain-containing protein n=1 Tax=Lutibacter citreus TaxID=2138210 RepID=UPI000DBE4D1D|nr:carboxypeptidase-like regulatory domain-containing protein [Lutibacter citreus]
MKLKLINFTIFIFLSSNAISQEVSIILKGEINNTQNNFISDVHIVNLTSKLGTISNDIGSFEILAKENDVLLFSSIEYKNIRIKVSKQQLLSKNLKIILDPLVNELDEVFLSGLTGNLALDLIKTPINRTPNANFSFKLSDLDKKLSGNDFGNNSKVNAESFTNPNYLANGGQGSRINKQLEKEKALKRKLNKQKIFPINLKKELGIDYFVSTLKIPKEEIFLFIEYCEPYNIMDKYYNNKVLDVIEILNNQSKSYNEK